MAPRNTKKRVVKPKSEKLKQNTPAKPLDPNEVTPRLTKKQLTVKKKVELANEVALAQLSKGILMTEISPVTQNPSPGKGKRKSTVEAEDGPIQTKRKKKSDESATEWKFESSSDDLFEYKMPKKKRARKNPTPKKIVIDEINVEPPDSAVKKTRGRKKQSRKKNDIKSCFIII